MIDQLEHEIVGLTEDGEYKFKFTNTEFNDIIVSIGGIEFIEGDENANMKFDYNIHEGVVPDDKLEDFKTLLGDFIVQAIEDGIKNNSLVYAGTGPGEIDENRDDDTEQPGV